MKSLLVAGFAILTLTSQANAVAAAPSVSTSQAQTDHLKALRQAGSGDIKGALRALQDLSLKAFPRGEKDRVFISMGRLNYELGRFDNAISAYSQVERTGPNWMEALEETAWAQFRLGRPQETIAKLKTVINPVFKSESTSEAYFLLGLAQLRVCDFKAVFNTIELFKKNYAETTKQLEAKNKNDLKLREIGETVQKLNLVEAETIQRLYVDENGKKRTGSVAKIEKSSDEISFPETDDDEFWLDEVDAYKVSVKGCLIPSARRTAKNEVVK